LPDPGAGLRAFAELAVELADHEVAPPASAKPSIVSGDNR
jgi:hypothetical protein